MTTDLYALLEVRPNARDDVIKAAYRALAKAYHPDRQGGDSSVLVRLNTAYAILSDTDKRREYDSERNDLEGTVIGDFRVIEKIAEGGFGTTYRGEHVLTGMSVCIKHCSQISHQDEEILIEETKAIWDLRHFAMPAARTLLRLEDGSFALVMSFIPGYTLEQIVEKHGALDPEHMCWIMERLLNALKYMHWHGVVHGDIKPQNIIIQPDTHTVVLVDFGLSMIKPKARSDSKGYTEHFAPPEQMSGKVLVPESDFFSLGMTLLYGVGGGLEAVKQKRVPESVPDPICELIKRLIKLEVTSRPGWQSEDLFETIQEVRSASFGRSHSDMKPLPTMK